MMMQKDASRADVHDTTRRPGTRAAIHAEVLISLVTVAWRVVQTSPRSSARSARRARSGWPAPKLVERELDGYVGCGVLARGQKSKRRAWYPDA
jgi:hypothetical protein